MNEQLNSIGPALANHLWQTTAFVAIIWGMTFALRKNQARVRYALWLAASLKFLLPFSLLIALGGMLPRPQRAVTAPAVYATVDEVAQPFAEFDSMPIPVAPMPTMMQRVEARLPMTLAGVWLCGFVVLLALWGARWLHVWRTLRHATRAESGREFDLLQRVAPGVGLRGDVTLRLSRELMEPGIFGVFCPVLIWPERLSEHLDDEHIEAILIHELAHARRRDNFTAALHMLVEALFWFHPLVWWMERRMIEERERACDEAVVATGSRPGVYAESLLKACRFCVESPLTCVAGITGADLSTRVRTIMTVRLERMRWSRRVMLAIFAVAAVAAPILLGQVTSVRRLTAAVLQAVPGQMHDTTKAMVQDTKMPEAPQMSGAQVEPPTIKFDVVLFKPCEQIDLVHKNTEVPANGDYIAKHCQTIGKLIDLGYTGPGPFVIKGEPDWVDTQAYDFQAKVAPEDVAVWQKLTLTQKRMMVRTMLEEQLHMKTHVVSKTVPIYALVVGKNGPKLTPYKDGDQKTLPDGRVFNGHDLHWIGNNRVMYQDTTMDQLAYALASRLDRPVEDRTGLKGSFDFTITLPFLLYDRKSADAENSSIPAILSGVKPLGLRLESAKGETQWTVVDHIDKPELDGTEVQQPPSTPAVQSSTAAAAPAAAFEVATIKPSNPNGGAIGLFTYPGGRILCSLCTFHYLMMEAFGVQDWQVTGGADWINDARYDIEAKPPQGTAASKLNDPSIKTPPNEEQRAMLRSLLAERFGLKYHRETADGPVYLLERGDKALKLETPKDKDAFAWAGSIGTGVRGTNISMSQLAARLSGFLGRPVLDKTGITGAYDFEERTVYQDSSTDISATLIGAMKQIGLKLTAGKGPVETIVIDHVERPSAN